MQYLYVVTSTNKDNYYEQFLLSLASLRLVMPNADIALLCDKKTKETFTGKRTGYEKLVSSIITVEAPASMNQIEVSRWLRTSARKLVKGDFLFIDSDTIITEDLSDIEKIDCEFAACLDKHSPLSEHYKKESIIKLDKKLGFNSTISGRHYNGGILYAKDTEQIHKLFDRWFELWLFSKTKKIVRDQPSLNMAIYELKNENPGSFKELDGIWNCQIAYNGLPYLSDSKIIHYFATDLFRHTSPYLFASSEIINAIKETGELSGEAKEYLKNPKAAFAKESRIISGKEMLVVANSDFFESIFFAKKYIPFIFHFFNGIASACKKILKYFIIKLEKRKDGGIKHYN